MSSLSCTIRRAAHLALMAAMAVLVAAVAAPCAALAAVQLDYSPQNSVNPVADNVTRLDFNKFEKGTNAYVAGAKMAIIDEETGEVVYSWTTGEGDEVIEKVLNVDTWYILREVEAPAGYIAAPDTRFRLHSEDFMTTGEISNPHEDVEFAAISGNGPEQAFVINLYDRMEAVGERHVPREIEERVEQPPTPHTGDATNLAPMYLLCALGVAAMAGSLHLRRHEL